jgi:hypothetical protein
LADAGVTTGECEAVAARTRAQKRKRAQEMLMSAVTDAQDGAIGRFMCRAAPGEDSVRNDVASNAEYSLAMEVKKEAEEERKPTPAELAEECLKSGVAGLEGAQHLRAAPTCKTRCMCITAERMLQSAQPTPTDAGSKKRPCRRF